MKPHVQRRALAAVAEREELHVMTIERLGWLTVSRALFFFTEDVGSERCHDA
jgi:hypothetical protein